MRCGELGREHDLVAPAVERLAEEFLGTPLAAVDVGRIEEVDAGVDVRR